MAKIIHKGNEVNTVGNLPVVGSSAPDFLLTTTELKDVRKSDFAGKKVLLNIFPSLDTGICAMSVRKFHEKAAGMDNVVVVNVSMDLPFAHKRFCAAEGIEGVVNASELRRHTFGEDYGVRLVDGSMAGLFARAVVILDEQGDVIYTEQVPQIAQEPDYDRALEALLGDTEIEKALS